MSDLEPRSSRLAQAYGHLLDKACALGRRVTCRVFGCRWGFWLPADWSALDMSKGVVHAALRQCLRCRTLQRGPDLMQHESRRVQ